MSRNRSAEFAYSAARQVIDTTWPEPRNVILDVFDFGAGAGGGRAFLPTDILYAGIDKTRGRIRDGIVTGDFLTDEIDGDRDAVLCLNVIHVISDKPALFRRMRDTIKDDGVAVIAVRASQATGRQFWDAQLRAEFGKVEWFTFPMTHWGAQIDTYLVAKATKPRQLGGKG